MMPKRAARTNNAAVMQASITAPLPGRDGANTEKSRTDGHGTTAAAAALHVPAAQAAGATSISSAFTKTAADMLPAETM